MVAGSIQDSFIVLSVDLNLYKHTIEGVNSLFNIQ